MDLKKRILIVDDDQMIVWLMEKALSQEGYEIFTAHDGEEALEKARKFSPDLMLLNVMMPVMDGYEVCRRIKADATTAGIDILVLSAVTKLADGADDSHVRDQIEGLDLGAAGYLSKPIKIKTLKQRVARLLAASSASA